MLAKSGGFYMFKAPRGTVDILPMEQPYWGFVREKAERSARLYGYNRIDTPVFEQTGLFYRSIGAGTDIAEKEMYTFDDRSGDSMTLRPEGTASVCRAYIENGMHNLPQPVRLYYLGTIFRYERPQAGRYRQHQQFGCEALGDDDPALDAEIIDMAWNLYDSLGLRNLTLQLNSIGCKVCRPSYLDALKEYYFSHNDDVCRDCRVRIERNLLRVLDCKEVSCRDTIDSAPLISDHLCADCSAHFEDLKGYLGYLKIPFELNPHLVRGLDYYNRTVFEIQPEGEGAQNVLGGGGRYDGLIEQIGGKSSPGVGFGTGIERIILNLKKQDIVPPPTCGSEVFLAYQGEEARVESIKLAGKLRRDGIGVTMATGSKRLKAQMKQANTLGKDRVIIIGEEEMWDNSVMLRDMEKGEQKKVARDKLPSLLKKMSS